MILNDVLSVIGLHTVFQIEREVEGCPHFFPYKPKEFGNIRIKTLHPFLNDRVIRISPRHDDRNNTTFLVIEIEFQDHECFWDDEIYEDED